jgi:hypothetical protein
LKYDPNNKKLLDKQIYTKTNEQKLNDQKELNQVFNNKEGLVLFQLPDILQLHNKDEGHIGKLVTRRSGRIELILNNNKRLNVSQSVSYPVKQDAVSIEINEEMNINENECPGKLIYLGPISNKVICTPNIF